MTSGELYKNGKQPDTWPVIVKYRGHTQARDCPDCGSSHIGLVPCGMTYRQRLCSTTVDNSVLATRTKKNYYDSDTLSQLVPDHAHEQMMEETGGIGPVSRREMNQYSDLMPEISAYYAGGDEVE